MHRLVRFAVLGLVVGLLLVQTAAAAPRKDAVSKGAAPEVFGFNPGDGPAGTKITVQGSGLEKTRGVLFCVGKTSREAKFKVVSDAELQVIAPAYYRAGTSAILAVFSSNGATVCLPASVRDVDRLESRGDRDATFYHVLNHGVATAPNGIVLVDEGGVSQAPRSAPVAFVRNGGTLYDAEHFSGLLIHEPRAVIQADERRNAAFRPIQVPVITASLGIEPFIYHRPDSFGGAATAPPVVQAMRPDRAQPGDFLTLTGTGFSETNQVLFLADGFGPSPGEAGFRIVSDRQLEVELPDNARGSGYLIVVNPQGATLVANRLDVTPYLSRSDQRSLRHAGFPGSSRAPQRPVILVDSNSIVNDGGGGAIYFVQKGGLVTHTGGGCTFLVKSGGRVSFGGSGGQRVFYETGAEIDGAPRNGKSESTSEVGSLSISVLPTKMQISSR